jgi:hypothetical protein
LSVPLYAAYGSNMHPEQMQQRAPHSPMAGTGWLHGWRLTFGGEDIGWDGALATVVEDPTSKVFVVLYDMTSADEKTLDRWEGSELGIHKKIRCRVERVSSDTTTDPVLAWLYVVDAWEGGLPSARYIGVMADAAEIAGAPTRSGPVRRATSDPVTANRSARLTYRGGLLDDVDHQSDPDRQRPLVEVERRLMQVQLRTAP